MRSIESINLQDRNIRYGLIPNLKYTVHVDFNKEHLQVEENTIHIGLRADPVKGKANKELVKKLAKHFKVPGYKIRILAGYTSRTKHIEVVETT